MKRSLPIFIILFFLLYLLIYPADCVSAASRGLLLWYERVLPALLPFTICSNIIIASGFLDELIGLACRILSGGLLRHPYGIYPILSGFLFGFPLGSKACADLWREKKLTDGEATVLCAMCNNISPAFVSSFLLLTALKLPSAVWTTYAIMYLPPLCVGLLLLRRTKAVYAPNSLYGPAHKKETSRSSLSFQIIDAGIMNGFETMVKLGGYIMMFSLIVQLFLRFTDTGFLPSLCAASFLEVTNGIGLIAKSTLSLRWKYTLSIAATAFGGFSGIAQTASMTKGTKCNMGFYLIFKIGQTCISTVLAYVAATAGLLG